MNGTPNSLSTPPIRPVRYRMIWVFNVLVTGVALLFYSETGMVTKDFLDLDGMIFYAIPAFMMTAVVAGAGTGIFFLTIQICRKKRWGPPALRAWLASPAWVFALAVTAYALWDLTPQQRLTKVCLGTSVAARNIRVAGCTGMQMGEWLAVFETQQNEFRKLVEKQQLQPDSPENFADKLDHAVMIKKAAIFASLPATTNSQCFKREVIGIDGNLHGGIYAAYDSKTACAVVFSDGY